MITTTQFVSDLNAYLPDELVGRDIRKVVQEDARGTVELDSGGIVVPEDSDYEVVSKAFIDQRPGVGFGSCFRVVIAIGGLNQDESGILKAKYAFAIFWYNLERKLITTDFEEHTPL